MTSATKAANVKNTKFVLSKYITLYLIFAIALPDNRNERKLKTTGLPIAPPGHPIIQQVHRPLLSVNTNEVNIFDEQPRTPPAVPTVLLADGLKLNDIDNLMEH